MNVKKYLLVALLIVATSHVSGQVLGGPSTYGSNSGIGFHVGTQSVFGREFVYRDPMYGVYHPVNTESYKPRLLNPIFGIAWWSEFPSDNFVIGYQILGSYSMDKYQVTLAEEALTNSSKAIGVDLNFYVGWHFGEQLTACIGVTEVNRVTVGNGKINIFATQNTLGVMAMARYFFTDDFFVSLQGSYGLLSWGGDFGSDWEKYDEIGSKGYYVDDSKLRAMTVMLGVGKGF